MEGRCSWCGCKQALVEGKTYCFICEGKMYRECVRCHKPYDSERFFSQDENRCNPCHKKYLKEKQARNDLKKSRLDFESGNDSDETMLIQSDDDTRVKTILDEDDEDLSIFQKVKNMKKRRGDEQVNAQVKKNKKNDEQGLEKTTKKRGRKRVEGNKKPVPRRPRNKKDSQLKIGDLGKDVGQIFGLVPLVMSKQNLAVMLD